MFEHSLINEKLLLRMLHEIAGLQCLHTDKKDFKIQVILSPGNLNNPKLPDTAVLVCFVKSLPRNSLQLL